MDIVSGGELYRVLKAGVPADRVVFSGVGKTESEIRYALDAGIHSFNVESKPELDELDRIAGEMGITAPVSIRVNPDVESYTHQYTSTGKKETKFGVPIDEAREIYKNIEQYTNIRARGLDCHIGSQITGTEPFLNAAGKMTDLFKDLVDSGVELDSFDFGGGLGIRYNEEVPHLTATVRRISAAVAQTARLQNPSGAGQIYLRKCGRTGDKSGIFQEERDKEFRDCRCRNERHCQAEPVWFVSAHSAGEGKLAARSWSPMWWAQSARPAITWLSDVNCQNSARAS